MRSVVVVLPASMWAMMPILRTLFRSVSTSSATVSLSQSMICSTPPAAGRRRRGRRPPTGLRRRRLPAVVGEGLVGFRHLVSVLATLDCGTEAVAGVEDLIHESFGHRLLTTLTGIAHQPPQSQSGRTSRADIDGHLVGGTADAAGPDLESRPDVVESLLQVDDGIVAVLLAGAFERTVDDPLGGRALAVEQDLVDQLRHERRAEDRIDDDRSLGCRTFAWHYFFSLFAPYLLRAC